MIKYIIIAGLVILSLSPKTFAGPCSFEAAQKQLDIICEKIATVATHEISGPEVDKVALFDLCGLSQASIFLPQGPDYMQLSSPMRPIGEGASNSTAIDFEGNNPFEDMAKQLSNKGNVYGKVTSSFLLSEIIVKKAWVGKTCVDKHNQPSIAMIGLYLFPKQMLSSSQGFPMDYSVFQSQEYLDVAAITDNTPPNEVRKLLYNLSDKVTNSLDYAKLTALFKVNEKQLKSLFVGATRRYLSGFRNENLPKNPKQYVIDILEEVNKEAGVSPRLRRLITINTTAAQLAGSAEENTEDEKLNTLITTQDKQISELNKLKKIFGIKLQNVIVGIGILSLVNLIGMILLLVKSY